MSFGTGGAHSAELLGLDAKNRALRTFMVNIATDVAVALVLVVVSAFGHAEGWEDFEWSLLAFTLAKTAVVTAGSYILRKFLDPSSFPTPLPPSPQPAPADPAGPESF